jgi:ribosome-binding protein aMBF1 (putative translation factor)
MDIKKEMSAEDPSSGERSMVAPEHRSREASSYSGASKSAEPPRGDEPDTDANGPAESRRRPTGAPREAAASTDKSGPTGEHEHREPAREREPREHREAREPAPTKANKEAGNKVRKLRLERMMSKAELARRANVSTLTIDRIERGMSCRMDTKRKILEALGLKPSDRVTVFGEED